jgi:hypothetical protein
MQISPSPSSFPTWWPQKPEVSIIQRILYITQYLVSWGRTSNGYSYGCWVKDTNCSSYIETGRSRKCNLQCGDLMASKLKMHFSASSYEKSEIPTAETTFIRSSNRTRSMQVLLDQTWCGKSIMTASRPEEQKFQLSSVMNWIPTAMVSGQGNTERPVWILFDVWICWKPNMAAMLRK